MYPGSILADDRNSVVASELHEHASWLTELNGAPTLCVLLVGSGGGGLTRGGIYGGVGMGLNLCENTTEINSVLIIKLQAASKTFEQFV